MGDRTNWFVPLGIFTALGAATVACPIKLAISSKKKQSSEMKEVMN